MPVATARPMARQRVADRPYNVQLVTPEGKVYSSCVVNAISPRAAIDTFCRVNNHNMTYVQKYSTWQEILRVFSVHGGRCTLCVVDAGRGGRKNYYVIYSI